MSLLKDIYDIIASEKAAKMLLDKKITEFLKGGLFKKEPTRQERKTKLKPLIDQMTNPNFSSEFSSQLAFLGALTGMIVECTYTAARGCIVEKLYLPDHALYFPSTAGDPSLGRYAIEKGKEQLYALKNEDKTDYIFYAIHLPVGGEIEAADIAKVLADIAESNPIKGERQALLDWLENSGIKATAVVGIGQHVDTNAFRYVPTQRSIFGQSEQLPLNFSDKATMNVLQKTLTDLLSASVI
ncbi:hypothetical protein [Thiobacillus denitrificans]|jgi:hypothetical protein|uniref:hypothetical protein n=1 Tax=Thiobacillus denitrificans TaxID=36861 RepID=UPI00038217C1|nr:hypothetical protein [Thiobacillus denitrificans]